MNKPRSKLNNNEISVKNGRTGQVRDRLMNKYKEKKVEYLKKLNKSSKRNMTYGNYVCVREGNSVQ